MASEPAKLNGKVVNGVVVFENGSLPDGTEVSIEPVSERSESAAPKDIRSLSEMLMGFAGVIKDDDLPTDLSYNLDHYLYGTPKKSR